MGGLEIFKDITELKILQEEIVKREKKYRRIFEGSHDMIYTSTLEGNILDINALVNCLPEGIAGTGTRYFEDIVAIHANSIFGIKTGYFLSSRVEITYAPVFIKSKETVRNPV